MCSRNWSAKLWITLSCSRSDLRLNARASILLSPTLGWALNLREAKMFSSGIVKAALDKSGDGFPAQGVNIAILIDGNAGELVEGDTHNIAL